MSTKAMFETFQLTKQEYQDLYNKFNYLCKFETWQLWRKNVRNNHTEEIEDIEQDLLWSMVKAGVYYKRQTYIEHCLQLAKAYAKDPMMILIVAELNYLWENRTRHGANRQKFGERQEAILDNIVNRLVPRKIRPNKNRKLMIDKKFTTYCKQITWNQQKSLGRKITKERGLRSGMASLSDFDYLAPVV